jgi:hypothetical protein
MWPLRCDVRDGQIGVPVYILGRRHSTVLSATDWKGSNIHRLGFKVWGAVRYLAWLTPARAVKVCMCRSGNTKSVCM